MTDATASHEVRLEQKPGSKPGVVVLTVSGPLTIRNFFDFQDLTRNQQAPVLVIDLSEVPYIDSAALGSLLGLHVSCGRHGRKYGLVNVNERLRTMFGVAGVAEILVTFPTLAAAEASLA